ncbi:expressed unknown protein [Seminavis robusta]|uniref:Uncharacterized protein n=1 Tax=Seminavis robusta TaxID=568900 RepID=A0A9N8I149_9STRA|nr:expressed unknown protein [Seminavis robusta]|eukprot:Sro3120_g344170.1 n/a (154) ;mRNA; r:630-1091
MDIPSYFVVTNSAPAVPITAAEEEIRLNNIPSFIVIPTMSLDERLERKLSSFSSSSSLSISSHLFHPSNERWSSNGAASCEKCPPTKPLQDKSSTNSLTALLRKAKSSHHQTLAPRQPLRTNTPASIEYSPSSIPRMPRRQGTATSIGPLRGP